MQQLNISLNKGVHRSPSYAHNGELAECVNLYVKDGELRNIPKVCNLKDGAGQDNFVLAAGHTLVALHSTDNTRIYISRKAIGGSTTSYELYANVWEEGQTQDEPVKITDFTTDDKVRILTLGRMMMVVDISGLHYFIWKSGSYKFLDDELPKLQMNFGLQGEVLSGVLPGELNGHFDTSDISLSPDGYLKGDDSHAQAIIMQAYAKAAEISNAAGRDGYFTHCFFVRYALRMYDGQRAAISAPVLMTVSTNELFLECNTANNRGWGTTTTDVYYSMIRAQLDYLIPQGTKAKFNDWSDLIKGVDIFISSPIYTYQIDGDELMYYILTPSPYAFDAGIINSLRDSYGFTVSKLTNINDLWAGSFKNDNYVKRDIMLTHAVGAPGTNPPQCKMASTSQNSQGWNAIFRLQPRLSHVLQADWAGEGPYFLLHSYDISELVENTRTIVNVATDRINNITTQIQLTEVETFDNISKVSDALLYNRRLALSGVTIDEVCKQSLLSLLPKADAWQGWACGADGYPAKNVNDWEGADSYHLSVELQDMNEEVIRVDDSPQAAEGTSLNIKSALIYLSYLDLDVSKLIVYKNVESGSTQTHQGIKLPNLKKNVLTNGTYFFGNGPMLTPLSTLSDAEVTPTAEHSRSYPSRMLLSEVENPFVYKLRNEYEIGAGRVLRLAALTEQLSSGQYGQFPVVAFCSDGMYALEVRKEDGTLYDPKPLQPDVLTNIGSVISVDGGILYVTNQGLKFLGKDKQIRLLTGPLEGHNLDEDTYKTLLGTSITDADWKPLFAADTDEIRQALQSCRMVYDGKNRLVRIFFEGIDKQTVLSLETGEFSSQIDRGMPISVIEDYGMSIMQFPGDQNLYVYDAVPDTVLKYGMLISRILNFSEVEQYTIIRNMRVYKSVLSDGGQVGTAVFVSPDKKHWSVLKSLKGASYKYIRFALFTKMDDYDAVSGLALLFDVRRNNKLR